MYKNVDKLLDLTNSQGKYQYTILVFAFLFWVCNDLLSISLPYLGKRRIIYDTSIIESINTNSRNNTRINTFSLNYSICASDINKTYRNHTIEKSGHSWVIEFDIECDKARTGLIGSFSFFGVLVSSILFQFLPDTIGRKNTVLFSAIMSSLIYYSFNFKLSLNIALILAFLLQSFSHLAVMAVFLMATEITSTALRSFFGAVIFSAFSFCGIVFIPLYKYLDNWRFCFNIASTLNILIIIVFYTYSGESPRYYSSKGQSKEMMKSLKFIADYNSVNNFDDLVNQENFEEKENFKNSELPDENVNDNNSHKNNSHNNNNNNNNSHNNNNNINSSNVTILKEQESIWSLLKYSSIRQTFLVNCYLWFSTSGMYYGLSIYLKNLPGDIYFNGFCVYATEIFICALSGWLINAPSFGRKGSMLIFVSISLLSFIFLIINSGNHNHNKTLLSFLARFAINGMYNILHIYSSEVYPTVLRAKGFGMNSISARFGGILFPILIELLDSQVFVVFAILNSFALLLILLLPETLGKPLEDYIQEKKIHINIKTSKHGRDSKEFKDCKN